MRTLLLIVAFLCALALACRPLDGRSIGVLDANVDESSLVELNQLNHPTPPTPTQAHRIQQRATPKKTTATAKKTTPKKTASTKKAADTKKATNTKKAATAKTAAATSAKVTAEMKSPSEAEFKKLFTAYKTKFKRKYKSATTEATAYKSFKTRYMKSHEKNERAYAKMAAKAKAKGKPAPKAVAIFNAEKSPLGDVEDSAFKRKYLGGRPPSASSSSHKKMLTELSKKPRSKTVAATAKSAAARFAELGLDEDNSSGIHMLMEIASELDQQQWPSPQPSQPLAPQPLTAPQSWPTTQPLAPQPVTGPQSWPTTQPSQPWKGGALPAVNSVPAPSGGDNKAKGRKGGDNKASGRKGGDNKASTRKGGDNKASGRKGGDDDNVSTNDISQQSLDADIQGATFKVGPVGFAFGNSNLRMLHDMSNRFPASTRNQGDCQSCWAVTASEHFQSILTSTLLFSVGSQNRLSAQQIIDCQISNVDLGCNGGTVTGAFDYIQLKGVSIASKYPYPLDGTQHACATPAADAKIFKAQRSLFLVPPCLGDVCAPNPMAEATLLDFWQNPPYRRATTGQTASIPVIAYVDSSNWQDYTGGIFPSSECSSAGGDLNHIVQIVGYGMDSTTGQAFWLVRNSWGSDWGEKGYIRLPYGENACGIFNYVIYLEAKEDIPMDANSVRVRNLQAMVNASPRVKALASMQALVNGGR